MDTLAAPAPAGATDFLARMRSQSAAQNMIKGADAHLLYLRLAIEAMPEQEDVTQELRDLSCQLWHLTETISKRQGVPQKDSWKAMVAFFDYTGRH